MKYGVRNIDDIGGNLREALIVVGIAVMLGAGMVVLWSSIELRNLERAQDVLDDFDPFFPFNDPYNDIIEEEFDKQRDYYSTVRIVGVVGLAAGAIIVLYGLLFVKEEPRSLWAAPSTPPVPAGAMNYCEHCGRQISPGAVWCPGCGRKFKPKGYEGSREQEVL
ncbi:MAG: zinc ribbon domain-containing protein [Thermoplasmata archaeon]|nr:zinc ribbon domain-containing protein [Thermoplasmata archaeon]